MSSYQDIQAERYYAEMEIKEKAFNTLLEGEDFYDEWDEKPVSITYTQCVEYYEENIAYDENISIIKRLLNKKTHDQALKDLENYMDEAIRQTIDIYIV